MHEGTVVWFNSVKGWGFLRSYSDNKEYFVHYSEIVGQGFKELRQGDNVQFSVEMGPRGKEQATRVTVVKRSLA